MNYNPEYSPEDDGAYRYTILSKHIKDAMGVADFMGFSVRQWNWGPSDSESAVIKDKRPWEGRQYGT